MMIIQISLLLLISGSLSFMIVETDIYDRVQSGIVEVLCLSCLKLEPKTELDFIFDTSDGQPHPDFILKKRHREEATADVAISFIVR